MKRFVIVGGGQAGGQVAMSLRRGGFEGELVLVTAEAHAPYQRPPLSKHYLAGKVGAERLSFPPAPLVSKLGLDLRTGVRVAGLDADTHSLGLDDGSVLNYDGLALALGASPIRLSVPGAELAGIHTLRTLEDADAIRAGAGRRVVVVGAGYIGLEVAATLRELGAEVTVLEREQAVMPRVASAPIAGFFAACHRDQGVAIELGAEVVAFGGSNGQVSEVETATGARFPADLVVVGIGIRPNVALAQEAGLSCDNGIVVDALARTSDPMIVAAGDCTHHPNELLGRRLRLESVHNALEQAKTAAASLLGQVLPYRQIPWFWSDQYHYKWQSAGLATGADELVIRGDEASGDFAVYSFRNGRLIAVDTVCRPREHMAARTLLNAQTELTADEVRSATFDPAAAAAAAVTD